MTLNQWLLTGLFAAWMMLGGCSGHLKFSDDEYRLLGDTAPVRRGN